jgi:hypothetical protein
VRIAVTNIPTQVGPDAWRECWDLTADRADIFGANEVFTRKARRMFRRRARKRGYDQYGMKQCPNPVFWNARLYVRTYGKVHRIHGGHDDALARLYPGFNDARYMNEVVLAPVDGGPEVAVLCSHWVPSGRRVDPKWRKKVRRESKALTAQLTAKHKAAGRIVVFLADTNIYPPILVAGLRFLRKVGIDKIAVAVPAGMVILRAKARTFWAPTDHGHGVRANIRLAGTPTARTADGVHLMTAGDRA